MKKLTVLCMLGLFVLISANTDSIAAPREDTVKKCNDGKDNDGDLKIDGDDEDCIGVGEDPGGGGGGGGDTYQVDFSGALPGGGNGDTYEKGVGNGIGSQCCDALNDTIDLTHFADLPMPAGDNCFGGGDDHVSGHTFHPWGVSVRQGRRGRAEATVIFRAQTVNGDPAVYSLHTIGFFESLPSGWPPEDTTLAAIVTMTSWEMLLNNHNPSDLMGACLSEGPFDDPGTPLPVEETWQITVSLN